MNQCRDVNAIIEQYQPLVRKIAAKYRTIIDYDDACAAGTIGLWEAIKHWDSRAQTALSTLAYTRIRARIIDEIRIHKGRKGTSAYGVDVLSLDEYTEFAELQDSNGSFDDHIVSDCDIETLLRPLTPQQRYCLMATVLEHYSAKHVAKHLGISVSKVYLLRQQAIAALRDKLNSIAKEKN